MELNDSQGPVSDSEVPQSRPRSNLSRHGGSNLVSGEGDLRRQRRESGYARLQPPTYAAFRVTPAVLAWLASPLFPDLRVSTI